MGLSRVPANDRFDGGRGRLHASRDDHNVRAPQRRERFAQAARGQHHAAAKRIRRVHQNDVGIARQVSNAEIRRPAQTNRLRVSPEPCRSCTGPPRRQAELFPQAARAAAQLHRSAERRSLRHPRFLDSRASESPCASLPARVAPRSPAPSGVLPVPPTVRFPTLITVPGNLRFRKMPRA